MSEAIEGMRVEVLESYGMRQRARCLVARPRDSEEMARALSAAARAGMTVGLRGSGRSYGDAALNHDAVVLECSAMDRILAWDPATGEATVEPGVTIEQLWHHTLADGWWPAVVPGTMTVSIGGAAAADIHGKNQWLHGSFAEHVLRFDLMLPSGAIITCGPHQHADVFAGALGGWGLLGCFTSITLRLRRIISGLVHVRQTAHPSLDALLAALEAGTATATHLVGWIDTGARGAQLGRGLLKAMRELAPGEDPDAARSLNVAFQTPSDRVAGVVPVSWVPRLARPIATPAGICLANRAQWWRGGLPGATRPHLERYVPANFVLDYIPNFRRVYAPGGLIQQQTFAPRALAADLFRDILARAQHAGVQPALAVLKKHRPSPIVLGYLCDGYSLALDFAVLRGRESATLRLVRQINALVAEAGGRFFLAKDSTLTAEEFAHAFTPRALEQFRALKATCDPDERLQTDIYRRVVRPALRALPEGA